MPTLLSYISEKKLTKHPEEFGRGAIEGVAGPEAANNASAAGTLVPLLAIGLPTTATAAVILAAMQSYGLQPGPALFDNEPILVWTLLAGLFIANTLLVLINLPLAPLWAKLLRTPRPYLYAGILFFASLGAYSVNFQAFDLLLLLIFGVLGLGMRRFGIPVLPLIIGVILGPQMEYQLAQALAIDPSISHAVERAGRGDRLRRDRPRPGAPGRPLPARAARPARRRPARPRRLARVARHPPRQREGDPMTVVVAYSNDTYGAAALDYGVAVATEGQDRLVVVNATRGDKLVDDRYAGSAASDDVRARLEALPVEAELRQSISPDVADEVLGGRRGGAAPAARGRRPPPHAAREADHGQRGPAPDPRGALPGGGGQAVPVSAVVVRRDRLGDGRPLVKGLGRSPLVRHDLAVLDRHLEHAGVLTAIIVVPQEIAEAVVDVAVPQPARPLQHVGVGADDDVGTRPHQGPGGGPLLGVGTAGVLVAPVQVDDDHVAAAVLALHRGEQVRGAGVARRGDAGALGPGRPGVHGVLPPRRGGQEGEVGAADAHPVRSERLGPVATDTHQRHGRPRTSCTWVASATSRGVRSSPGPRR